MTGTQYTQYIAGCSMFTSHHFHMLCYVHDTNTDALTYKTTLTYGRLVRHQDKEIQ